MTADMATQPQPFEVPTAAESRGYGASLGLTGGALDAYVKAGAAYRHARRVTATSDCARHIVAVAEISEHGLAAAENGDQNLYDLMVLTVLTLELRGIGGPGGYGHPTTEHGGLGSTDRLLSSLGKGRWHASDGDAWRAACEEATRHVSAQHEWREVAFDFFANGAVVVTGMNEGVDTDEAILDRATTSLPAALIDRCREWLEAEAKRTLRDALAKLPQQGNPWISDATLTAEEKQTLVEIANGAAAFIATEEAKRSISLVEDDGGR